MNPLARAALPAAFGLALALSAALPAAPPLSAQGLSTNVGIAMSADIPLLAVDGRRVVFAAREVNEGRDLNGDGDLLDSVLHAYDAATGALYNHGMAVRVDIAVRGNVVLYSASENDNGADYNGDDDKFDSILHQAAFNGSQKVNVGHAVTDIVFEESYAVVGISEIATGQVLNGDGDASDDRIVALYDPAKLKLTLLRRAVMSFSNVATTAGAFAFAVDEPRDDRDHNGDGDQIDQVPFTHVLASGKTTNSQRQGHIVRTALPDRHRNAGSRIAMRTSEAEHGADLSGDGDLLDEVPAIIDLTTGKIVHDGAPGMLHATASSWLVEVVDEAELGKDASGDGDALDHAVGFHNLATGAAWSPELALAAPNISLRLDPAPQGLAVGEVREFASGQQDLNGDGDAQDTLLAAFDPAQGWAEVFAVHSTCQDDILDDPHVQGQHALACSNEAAAGQDLNGDGDLLDRVAQGVDLTTGALRPSGMAMSQTSLGQRMIGSVAFFVASEADQQADLDGDGDQSDVVVHRLDAATGASTGTGLRTFFQGSNPRWMAGSHELFARIIEGHQDFNGDGDKLDTVLFALR